MTDLSDVPPAPPVGGNKRDQVKQAAWHKREDAALELKIAGASDAEIARQLGWKNKSTANRAVSRAIARIEKPNAERYFWLNLAATQKLKLQSMQLLAEWMPKALGDRAKGIPPSAKAEETVARQQTSLRMTLAHEARLFGFLKQKVEVTGQGGAPLTVTVGALSYESALDLMNANAGTVTPPPAPEAGPAPGDPIPDEPR